MKYPRGSLWRKWDLQFHTPSSHDYKHKSLSNEDIIKYLKKAGISVVAITDHHLIDVKRIKELQHLGGDDITILPGIEIRSELGGKESIHYIAIFPEDCDIEELWRQLSVKLEITKAQVADKGHDNVCVDFKDGSKVIHDLGGLVTVHAGRKTNTIENIVNTEVYKQVIKKSLLCDCIDILEVGQIRDLNDYKDIVFPDIGFQKPIILCSDNHDAKNYTLKEALWIKANPNFKGLKQLLYDPEERCFIGNDPPKINHIESNKTKYLHSLSISKVSGNSLSEKWFDTDLEFNPDLIALIGNRGSGKSALADILGLLGNAKVKRNEFSFLNDNQFLSGSFNRGKYFNSKLIFEDGTTNSKSLDKHPDNLSPERVKYIPQNSFEKLCTEINTTIGESSFEKEIKRIIYDHLPNEDKQGVSDIDDLVKQKIKPYEQSLGDLRADLTGLNTSISKIEDQLDPEYKRHLERLRNQKKEELTSIIKAKPKEVTEPKDEDSKKRQKLILDAIELVEKQLKEINSEIEKKREELITIKTGITNVESALLHISNLEDAITRFKRNVEENLSILDIPIEKVLSFSVDRKLISERNVQLVKDTEKLKDKLSPKNSNGLIVNQNELNAKLKEHQDTLEEPYKIYQTYLGRVKGWEEDRNEIIGNEQTQGTLKYYKKKIKLLDDLPSILKKLYVQRIEKAKEIFCKLIEIKEIYKNSYSPVQEFIEENQDESDKLDLTFDVKIQCEGFTDKFFKMVNRGKTGTYYEERGEIRLTEEIKPIDWSNWNSVSSFLSYTTNNLLFDNRKKQKK